ncbi:hypothetical protein BAE31_18695 [Bacillus sp. I-2]|uniref:Uncharacterized protein n=1 Tax=Bacillus safensis TaxID=561879 RepID=A0A1L6ZJH1_BACIA|nr:hypothetical protein BSA145_12880 [Bacillus safensis]KRE19442.1 hypothetical protein ASE42_05940 [Bacillus sp. Root920]OMP29113.1 hypothetical protein BAE31_18695 [Bacillus sp. I-2]PAK37410.1 hypothetical protein CHI04_00525 [Bacillus safensis]
MGIQKKTNGKGDVIRPFLFYLFSSISFKKRLSKHINSAIILILKVLSKRRSQGTIGCVSLGIYGGEPNEREALLGETQSIIRGSDISNALVCK